VSNLTLPSATIIRNERFATYDVQFAHPLQPREHTTLQFDFLYQHRGFTATAADTSIAANGSFITPAHCFPILGYRRGYEISDPIARKKRGLPPAAAEETDIEDLGVEWTNVDVTISTEPDQIALAPGRLVNDWTANNRRYFHYRSDAPIHNNLIFASARYAVARASADKTQIEVYYDPAHRYNVDRILAAAVDSIHIFENAFGPYRQSQLRIAEAPAYAKFGGLAMPGLVFLSESRAFLIDERDPSNIDLTIDLVSRRTAHEVAHQWWGHSVTPAVVPGASTIIESLPRYSELLLLDKRHGRTQVRRSLQFELDRYLAGRAADEKTEVPLTRVTDQAYLFYGKGAIVMNALKELLGEETLNRALRTFVAAQSGPAHQPKIDDLLQSIEAVTPLENRTHTRQRMDARRHPLRPDYDLGQHTPARRRPLRSHDASQRAQITRRRTPNADQRVDRSRHLHNRSRRRLGERHPPSCRPSASQRREHDHRHRRQTAVVRRHRSLSHPHRSQPFRQR